MCIESRPTVQTFAIYRLNKPIYIIHKRKQTSGDPSKVELPWHNVVIQEAQLSLTNRSVLVCKVVEVWQDFLSEYVDKKFTYICYRRLIRHE